MDGEVRSLPLFEKNEIAKAELIASCLEGMEIKSAFEFLDRVKDYIMQTTVKMQEDVLKGDNMSTEDCKEKDQSKQERLETALLEFIEQNTKGPLLENNIVLVPAMAHELIEMWSRHII